MAGRVRLLLLLPSSPLVEYLKITSTSTTMHLNLYCKNARQLGTGAVYLNGISLQQATQVCTYVGRVTKHWKNELRVVLNLI